MECKIKKFAAGLVLALSLAGTASAEQPQAIGPFSGINNTDNPLVIPAPNAQDLLNVDITPGGKSFKKRKGFGLQFNLIVTTSPVHGIYNFYDASGNEVSLFFHDRYGQASVAGASLTTLFSTTTVAATWQCTDSLGFAYCANSARDPIIKTNGVTYSQLTVAPQGTIVAATPERLLVAGTSGTPQRINFSKANDFTTWTVGSAATDPNQEDITSPGSRITHITYAFGKIIWFKDSSFGSILGTDNTNWQIITISPTIGTVDNSSVYRDGILYFRGQDGHIYGFDGSVPVKLTRELGDTISASAARRSNSWTVSTQSDFAAGNMVSTITYLSSYGGIVISTNNVAPTDGGFESNLWSLPGASISRDSVFPSGFGDCLVAGPQAGSWALKVQPGTSSGFSSTVSVHNSNSGVAIASTTITYAANQCTWTLRTITGLASSARQPAYIRINNTFNTAVSTSPIFVLSGGDVTFYSASNNNSAGPGNTIWFDSFETGMTTFIHGVYYSAVRNAPNLTSWDTLTATKIDGGGTHAFFIRSSTNPFTILSSTPAWNSTTAGSAIGISTGTYFQWKDSFTVNHASYTPVLQSVTVNWFEGAAADKAYAIYHENAIWWSAAVGVGISTNNYVLRYDLINQTWNLYDIGMNGMLVRSNALYFGSSSAGKIFKFGDAENDNGAAINAYWKSKDFFGDSPFTDKEFRTLSLSAASVANSTMTVTYTVNGSSSSSYSFTSYDANSSFIRNNKNLPLGRNGGYFNVKVGNNAADQPFEVFGILYTYEPKPWRPSQ